jgi:hypothetical protein
MAFFDVLYFVKLSCFSIVLPPPRRLSYLHNAFSDGKSSKKVTSIELFDIVKVSREKKMESSTGYHTRQ